MRHDPTNSRSSQETRILWLLQSSWPNEVPSPELAKISLQYGSRIFSLRKQGWLISNRARIVKGIRYGEFRLGAAPIRSNQELRQAKSEVSKQAGLFGDISPDRSYRE
jgi:hypothetical protein